LGTTFRPPTAVNDAVCPPITPGSGGGGGGGGGNDRFGGGPSRDGVAEPVPVGEAGLTRSGISRGVSCGLGGLVGEPGGVAVPCPLAAPVIGDDAMKGMWYWYEIPFRRDEDGLVSVMMLRSDVS
jgi:hypothetical protein